MNRSNISECRECSAPIVWMITSKGKNIPVNIDSVSDDDQQEAEAGEKILFVYGTHTCHFNDCPAADSFRKKDS
jgi:hypothetical protein